MSAPSPRERLKAAGIALPEPKEELVAPTYTQISDRPALQQPFIEALGGAVLDVVSFEQRCLDALPVPPVGGLALRANPVLTALESYELYAAVYPTGMLKRLLTRLIEVVVLGYRHRSPLDSVQYNKNIHLLAGGTLQSLAPLVQQHVASLADTGSPLCLMVSGTSGMGKTFGVKRVLKELPHIWRHTSYKGIPLNHLQVPYLYVSCPANGTLKSLLYEILLALDLRLGTGYYAFWLMKQLSIDVLLINVCLILYTHGVGLLVLDELQHLKVRNYRETEMLLNFFVGLMNFLSVPLLTIGTYAMESVIAGSLRDIRRLSSGGYIDFEPFEWNPSLRSIQDYYFQFLPGFDSEPDKANFHWKVFDIYQGIHYLLPNFVHRVTVEASLRGVDRITDEILHFYQERELAPLKNALKALRNKDAAAAGMFDDLLSEAGRQKLREYQATLKADKKLRQHERQQRSEDLPSRFSLDEFCDEFITDDDIAAQVRTTRLIFGAADAYPVLKAAGLIASDVVRGKWG